MKKPGINTPLICRKCGHKLGMLRIKSNIKWKLLWQILALGFGLDFLANILASYIYK